MNLRCFIAIELPAGLKRAIYSGTERLRQSGADARWVPEENLHLTLKFLGSTPEEKVPDIREALRSAVSSRRSFSIGFEGAGVFPDRRRPRVLWIGVADSESLVGLKRDVETVMGKVGFEEDGRPYSPHLTIGRLRSRRGGLRLMKELDELSHTGFGRMEVEEVSLMQSVLKSTGAEHTALYNARLGGR